MSKWHNITERKIQLTRRAKSFSPAGRAKIGLKENSTENGVEGRARPECGKTSFARTGTLVTQDRTLSELNQFLPVGPVSMIEAGVEILLVNR